MIKNVAGYDLAQAADRLARHARRDHRVGVPAAPAAARRPSRCCSRRATPARAAAFAAAVARRGGSTPTRSRWPGRDGRVVARFDSTPAAAPRAGAGRRGAPIADARACCPTPTGGCSRRASASRPVAGERRRAAASACRWRASPTCLRLAERPGDDLVLRAGVGVGEARLPADADGGRASCRDARRRVGGHVSPRRPAAELLAELTWPERRRRSSRSLTLAIKRRSTRRHAGARAGWRRPRDGRPPAAR